MKQPSECAHENFHAMIKVARLEDSGKFCAEITIHCIDCNEPFRFLGVPAGLNFRAPTCSIDDLELFAPIEPQGTPRLQAKASYEMPDIPTRH